MKIVLDNIVYSKSSNGGISNYWYELTKHLTAIEGNELLFIEEPSALSNFHRKQLPIESQIIKQKVIKPLTLARMLPVNVDIQDYFLYHSSFYRALQTSQEYSEITTIHDFTHDYYSPFLNKLIHNKLKYSAIKRSKGIICISQNTYRDLKFFCPPKPNQNVEIIYNGVSDDFFPLAEDNSASLLFLNRLKIENGYLLYVGSRASYKNFFFVSELLKSLPGHQLVVVGHSFDKKELAKLDKNLLSRIIIVSDINNSDLNILYNNAHVFIYPSSYEGFGIPIIEAMRAGCPVMAFSNSSITEVAGDAGLLFHNMHISEFIEVIENLNNKDFRRQVVEKGLVQSQKYSWKKCCEETYAFYKEIY